MGSIKSHICYTKTLDELGEITGSYGTLSGNRSRTIEEQEKYEFIGGMTGLIHDSISYNLVDLIYIYDGTYTYTYIDSTNTSSYSYYGGVGDYPEDTSYKYIMNFTGVTGSSSPLDDVDFYDKSHSVSSQNINTEINYNNINLVVPIDPSDKISDMGSIIWSPGANIDRYTDKTINNIMTEAKYNKGIWIDKNAFRQVDSVGHRIKLFGKAKNNRYSYWKI